MSASITRERLVELVVTAFVMKIRSELGQAVLERFDELARSKRRADIEAMTAESRALAVWLCARPNILDVLEDRSSLNIARGLEAIERRVKLRDLGPKNEFAAAEIRALESDSAFSLFVDWLRGSVPS